MNRATSKNVVLVIGVWTISRITAFAIRVLFNPINNGRLWTGDAGTAAMWIWLALPEVLVSAAGPIASLWVLETRKPLPWVGGLAALYLYDGSLHAWQLLTHGWRFRPGTSDYVGILTGAVVPALACLVVGVWWTRRSVARKPIAA